MASDKNKRAGDKTPKELYLKLPYPILNIRDLGQITPGGKNGCRIILIWANKSAKKRSYPATPRRFYKDRIVLGV